MTAGGSGAGVGPSNDWDEVYWDYFNWDSGAPVTSWTDASDPSTSWLTSATTTTWTLVSDTTTSWSDL